MYLRLEHSLDYLYTSPYITRLGDTRSLDFRTEQLHLFFFIFCYTIIYSIQLLFYCINCSALLYSTYSVVDPDRLSSFPANVFPSSSSLPLQPRFLFILFSPFLSSFFYPFLFVTLSVLYPVSLYTLLANQSLSLASRSRLSSPSCTSSLSRSK